MNDDTDKPLNTVGDDALEARITAWVLGEASSFEAGELEKLCAADPALGLFERRLRVLHGLVAEDFKTGPAVQWKLAAERRTKITDLLGVEPEVEQKIATRRKKSRGPSVRGLILALAACVVLGFISISLLGGVGESAKMARVKSSVSHDRFRAEAPMAMAPSDDFGAVERGGGVPVTKPDTSYAHLADNSAFTSKPSPAARAEMPQLRGRIVEQKKAVEEDQLEQLAVVEARQQSRFRHTTDAGIANETSVDAKAELDVASNSLALSKEKAAKGGAGAPGMPEQRLAAGRVPEPQGIAGPPPAPATPEPAPAPEAKPAAVAANERGTATRSKGEVGFGFVMEEATLNEGVKQPAEGAPEIASRNLIVPAEGTTIPGVPAAPGQKVEDIITAGNRSGDGAITRNNIDAILNNPAGRERAEAKGDGIAALTGTFSDEATAMIGKSVEGKPEGAKTWLEPDAASGPQVEFKTRNPNPGEPVNGAFGGGVDSLADAGGVQLEPPTQSRFSSSLRLGAERVVEQDEAAAFGNQEELGRLSRDRQQVELGNNLFYSDATSGGATGGAQLMDLAKKQNEAEPAAAVAGRWFGTTTDENTKGLKDTNSPGGAPADPFFDAPLLPGQPLGGLKRDMSDELAATLGDAEGEVRAKLLEQVDKAWVLPVPTGDADEVDGFVNQGTPIADGSADGPVPVTPAPAVTDPAAMEDVRRKLHTAEGGYNLGEYDEAHRAYEEVLRIDPYNKAARRGMEQVATARADYYRAAYDQTRAQLLADVDKAWELSVPPVVTGPQAAAGNAVVVDKRRSIIIPEINFVDSTLDEALDFLRVTAVERDAEPDPAKKGVNLVLAMPPADSGLANPATLKIKALQMKNANLGDVIDEIARATGLEVEVGADAVTFRTGPETISKADQIVDLMSETVAADEPFSTFSLHVSDASFKLAQAAMERGEVPAAEGIRPEEFYNAFDYGDPAPANGEPVVCVTEQSAHPAFAQRNLLRIGVRTGSQGRGASTPLNLTLLLDHSGSMEREDRSAGLAMAVRQLSSLLKEGDTITVAGFSRQPRLLADRLPGARAQELNDLIARTPSEGGTNLEEGLKLGEELAKRQFNPAAQNRVVLFTDGAANLGDARPEALQSRIEGLRQQGIAFDAAGFGADGLNDKLLERLTRNGNGRYYIVDGPEDADAGFAKQLAGAFLPAAENVKVQVRFNPARVAKYKLIGFEEHRLQKEDFRNDAVDAAEMAAEEAGNALYQIETLPQGEGEVGEVSVRFRDVASGQMVERTWTIPYDAQAPAFDQATPSIQLAGLAAFTAEKLRAAPMADAVDFQQLGQVYAGVRARYPNSQPVADLGSMIGKMK